MLKNDVVEFNQDYSVVVGAEVGRVDVPSGTRAIVSQGTDDSENKIECTVILPRFRNGLDFSLKVAVWALTPIDAPELDGTWDEVSADDSNKYRPNSLLRTRCLACNKNYVGDFIRCPDDATQLVPMSINEAPIGLRISTDTNWEMEITDDIALGRTASIWKAKRLSNGKTMAIKILPEECADPLNFGKSIKQEARILQKAEHPGVVKVYHYGLLEKKRPFFVMEYIDGEPLTNLINRMPLEKSKGVILSMARALSFLHRNEILHPAITTNDIMIIQKDPHAKLIDFGHPRIIGHKNGTYSVNGVMTGDIHTLAPEILTAKPNSKASNVYSLAAILFQALTGKTLFKERSNPMILAATIISEPAPSLHDIQADLKLPDELVKTVQNCLAKNPDERPSMQEFLAALAKAWPDA